MIISAEKTSQADSLMMKHSICNKFE